MPNPNNGNEWLAIKNISDISISINDWVIQDTSGAKQKISSDQNLESGESIQIETKFSLNNDKETIFLINSQNLLIDTFYYQESTKGEVITVQSFNGNDQQQILPTDSYANNTSSTEKNICISTLSSLTFPKIYLLGEY